MIISYRTLGGKEVYLTNAQANAEEDRIIRENAKAAKAMNPAKDYWAYWGRIAGKTAKQPKKVSMGMDSVSLIRFALGADKRNNGGKVDWVAIRDIAVAELAGGAK